MSEARIKSWLKERDKFIRLGIPEFKLREKIARSKASLVIGREFGEDPSKFLERRGLTEFHKWKLPARTGDLRIKTRRGHAVIRREEMTIKAYSKEQAEAKIAAAIRGRKMRVEPSTIRKIHDTELYAFTPVVLKKVA